MNSGKKNVLIVADVGGWSTYHVGDEAMLAANLVLLRRILPQLDPVVASNDPAWTSAEYGVAAVARLHVEAALQFESERHSPPHFDDQPNDPAMVRCLGRAHALVISGGGNLSSTWPELILERVTLFRAARAQNVPVLILGQTIGPNLTDQDRVLVAELLCGACWVGIRDISSVSLALALGVPLSRLSYQPDDAIHLPEQPIEQDWAVSLASPAAPPWIAVTFHPLAEPGSDVPVIRKLAAELQQIVRATGARLVFVPHAAAAASNSKWGDHEFGEALARALRPDTEMMVAPLMRAGQVRWLTSYAAMVISSRYHPIVFGLSSRLPSYAVVTSEYTRVKLEGALIHYGRGSDACSLDDALNGRLSQDCALLWKERAQIGSLLSDRGIEEEENRRLGALKRALEGAPLSDGTGTAALIPHLAAASMRGSVEIARLRRSVETLSAEVQALSHSRSASELYALALRDEVARLSDSLERAATYAEELERSRIVAETHARSLEIELAKRGG